MWGIFGVLAVATAWFEAELAELVIGAGTDVYTSYSQAGGLHIATHTLEAVCELFPAVLASAVKGEERDRITVMVNGAVIASDTPDAVRTSPEVQAAYLGDH